MMMSTRTTRSSSRLNQLLKEQEAQIYEDINNKSSIIQSPKTTLSQLLTRYNNNKINRTVEEEQIARDDLIVETTLLLRQYPEQLEVFKEEFIKNNMRLALKDNYVGNSPYYTIRPIRRKKAKTGKKTGKKTRKTRKRV
jgi:hypothetical protein